MLYLSMGVACVRLRGRHHYHIVDVDMGGQVGNIIHHVSNIFGCQRRETFVNLSRSRFISMKAHQRELCFDGAGSHLGYFDAILQ